MLNGKITYHEAQRYLEYLVRTEYIRSLINSEKLIINRAFIYNNPWLYRDYLPGSASRGAFQELLGQGVIVPFLFNETSPVATPPWITAQPEGFSAWVQLCKDARVQCMRFSWDDKQNQEQAQKALSFRFHQFATTVYAGNLGKFLEDLGLDTSQVDAFAVRLDELQERSQHYFKKHRRQHVVRTFLYEQFITAGNPTLRQYDGSRPFARAIKQLLDLAYNSNLADALGSHLLTPVDSPTRLVLQEWGRVNRNARELTTQGLIDMLRRDTFQLVQRILEREGLRSMGVLRLQDVRELRKMDEWKDYITTLRRLLDHPLQFAELANDVASKYIVVTDRMTDLVRERNLQQGSRLTAPWDPAVEVTLTIGGVDVSVLWTREGMISNIPTSPSEIAQMQQQLQTDPTTGDAVCDVRFAITDAQRLATHAQLATRIEVLKGRMESAREQWEEVVRKLGEALKSQEFTGEAEKTSTMSQQEELL